jgi:hypothetical protein
VKIEAVCERRGPHPEYLVRMTHEEAMRLGAVSFEPGEVLSLIGALAQLATTMTQIRWATRGMTE